MGRCYRRNAAPVNDCVFSRGSRDSATLVVAESSGRRYAEAKVLINCLFVKRAALAPLIDALGLS